MSKHFEVLETSIGRAGFRGPVRAEGGGMHNIFMAQLEGRECLYGEWEPVFESDGRRFNVKIISYGFKEDVYGEISVELTATRSIVNKKKLDQLMTLINNLFSERKITKDVIPFRGGSTFLGEVKFCVGWAIVSN